MKKTLGLTPPYRATLSRMGEGFVRPRSSTPSPVKERGPGGEAPARLAPHTIVFAVFGRTLRGSVAVKMHGKPKTTTQPRPQI
jgi:hypothetical protein